MDTKPTKAVVAAVLTLIGLLGVTLTDGQTQLVAAVVQLAVVTYAVWRTTNAPKPRRAGRGIGRYTPGGQS